MATKRKELQELRDELDAAKARGEQFQAELDFNQAEQQVLETEIIALETDITGVGLPISALIKRIQDAEKIGAQQEWFCILSTTLKIALLRIQRLEAIERKK